MIAKNDEAMRSRIWKISTMVSSVLIVIIAIFLLTKLFTTNPLEGSWVNEDGSLELKVQSGGELTAVLPEFAEGGQVEVPMSYTIDKGEKTISILDNEEEMQKIALDILIFIDAFCRRSQMGQTVYIQQRCWKMQSVL